MIRRGELRWFRFAAPEKGAIDQPDAPPAADFLRAIQTALASKLDQSKAIGLDYHDDASIREYLKSVDSVLLTRRT